ncbi:NUDIX domain-containing protein [Devosia sp. BSSL-BM10]|uniref:NUDIX domain-containing protein n=1 Tax=Devosia litorisediminis TaxID=2829817 RepID=A0A942EAF8_9HYPH|nr:NUDIX domain-containing protein [Devosia litorisediminis]MBS3850571.1 NUDIX domain-containing protein [Devosia litorisediminis]
MASAAGQITIAAAIILGADQRMLVVRKHGSALFQQPGGKIDAGETPEMALRREIAEEIAITLAPSAVVALGTYSAPAANEPGMQVLAHIFSARTTETPRAAAEIAELAWLDLDHPERMPLAPLLQRHIVPLARQIAGLSELAS